jgi:exodeoxyribonuclease V alpha subunit
MALTPEKLQELLAKARATKAATLGIAPTILETSPAIEHLAPTTSLGMHGEVITYNQQQQAFIDLATSGKSAVLLGAAGTGKSTCQRGVVSTLIQHNKAGLLADDGHKHLPAGTPGIIVCAYTRRAVNNIRKVMPEDMRNNCITIHKLLEYQPVYYEEYNEELGKDVKTMRFEPTRSMVRPLSNSIHTIIFEESSMIATELYAEVIAALQHKVQFIFIGDIQQLPPVFGSAVLGYKMLELPVVELTEVYRQALESPIIRLAHHILQGKSIAADALHEWDYPEQLKLHPWKKKLSVDLGLLTIAKFFSVAIDSGDYNYEEDMILIPFNKSFGTEELNKYIAQHLTARSGAVVHEIVAGFNKHYFAVGDRVMYEKEDATITNIAMNGTYVGSKYQEASPLLDRWGNYRTPEDSGVEKPEVVAANEEEDIDALLDSMSFSDTGGDEDRKRAASHVITLRLHDSDEEVSIDSAAAVNSLALGYAITVHKAQGSEARKVFLILHESHATMVQRELLYTAVTRARESLYVICPPDTFIKGVQKQKIKGNTLAEKALYFQGKVDRKEQQSQLPLTK